MPLDIRNSRAAFVAGAPLKRVMIWLVLPVLLLATSCSSAPGLVWSDADIGSPDAPGSHGGDATLTVTGAGKGEVGETDQLHFTYRTVPAGDVEIIARITDLEGQLGKSSAGLMVRESLEPGASSARVAVTPYADSLVFTMKGRGSASKYLDAASGWGTNLVTPVWLKLTRWGHEFAVYRSQDGKIWLPVHNGSGGAFLATGPLQIGFFVDAGVEKVQAKATFDHISIGPPHFTYRSSWVGNTYAQASTGSVTGTTAALWVGQDGTCLTNSGYDEAGEPSKIYRDGKVITNFRRENESLGNGLVGEGTITSDGSRVVLAGGRGLFETDMLARAAATTPLYFAHDLSTVNGVNPVHGLAISGNELFVSDFRDNLVLVGGFDCPRYYTVGNSSVNQTSHPIDTQGVANAAPEAVYQSQRECDWLPYGVPGLEPNGTYTVRCHFAEYKETEPGKRVLDIDAGGQHVAAFDVVAAAGGPFRAVVKDIPGAKADGDGKLTIGFTRNLEGTGHDGHEVICGFEVLKADGTRAFALNCGGAAVDGFASEVYEKPDRAFAFDRPGPMAADKRGDLWIIRKPDADGKDAAVRCFHPDGTFSGHEITGLDNPAGLGYDALADRLLVADNGPDQNVKGYAHLATSPILDASFGVAGAFGIRGGIYSGATPGLLHDPEAGGDARFYGLTGVGVDGAGKIYVACDSTGTDLRALTPQGKLLWQVCALQFVDCMDFDPDSDGQEVLGPFKHYHLDYSKTGPGQEWSYTAYNWNPARFGPPPRQGGSSGVVRRLGAGHARILFTSGQGSAGYIGIYRYEGEIAVPCGRIEPKDGQFEMWIDANGDGKETPDEISQSPARGGFQSFDVDQHGDIWMACMGAPTLRHYRFKGLNAAGVPLYGDSPADYEDIPYPGNGQRVSTWGQGARVSYDSDRDIMYLLGPNKDRKADKDNPEEYLARYDNWSRGNRTARWLIVLPDPATDPNFIYPGTSNPYGLAHQWMAMDAAGDRVFVTSLWGSIHVFNAADGKLDTVLVAGPEISGNDAWQDENMGVRAFQRKNGEYEILEENSGYGARLNLFRYRPQ